MSDKDISCRICRGGGSPSHPLLHPCKCRGSIKYIHQDCLMEWLRHSNKSTQKCDICNVPYKFRTIYDPNMPKRIPFKYIWAKSVNSFTKSGVRAVSIMLYIFCLLIQVPLFWKFIGRIYTWAVDGFLPIPSSSFIGALLFGELDFTKYDLPTDATKLLLFKVNKFFDSTYLSGVRYIFVCIIVHIAIFVEHEWIVRDEGYARILLKRIGQEPRTKLVDMLQQALNGVRTDGDEADPAVNANVERLEMMARALNDLREHPNANHRVHEEALRRVIERENVNEANESDHETSHEHAEIHNDEQAFNEMGRQDDLDVIIDNDIREDDLNDIDEQEENDFGVGNRDELDEDEAMQAANIGNGDLFDLLGIKLNLSTPIFLMFVCDLIVAVFLFVTYLLPHMLGNSFVTLIGKAVSFVKPHIYSKSGLGWSYWKTIEPTTWKEYETLGIIINTLHFDLVKPTLMTIHHLFMDQKSGGVSLVERLFLLTIGYSFIIFCVRKVMTKLESGTRPIMGTPRKIYKALFEMASTAKVFLIFAIEIFFFPVYCGWLLDFCIMPLLAEDFIRIHKDGTKTLALIFTSQVAALRIHYVRLLLYWASGTLYMLLFALFMGMIRGSILRPGVLFFIRSPDDPNARLIHDALMKPLMLQLSRIYLSAKVYTCFIIFGIGSVTWGMRMLVMPSNVDYNILLPIQNPSSWGIFASLMAVSDISSHRPLITKYCKIYWTKAFEISCYKLRLSHFILGRPISQERGYIVYRNVKETLLGSAVPDYSQPVTYNSAVRIFEEDMNVKACFIPDGSYVRAPDNDTVSRRFIKKLFVEVTKDDKLITPLGEAENEDNEFLLDSSDDEMNKEDAYAIVYRPPNFKLRCFGLIGFLWVFSVILLVGVTLISLILGRQVVKAVFVFFHIFKTLSTNKTVGPNAMENFDWRLADVSSILIGFRLSLLALGYWDTRDTGVNNTGDQMGPDRRANIPNINPIRERPEGGEAELTPLLLTMRALTSCTWLIWIVSVHKFCVDFPLRLYTDEKFVPGSNISTDYLINKYSIALHLFTSLWTVVPFFWYLTTLIKLRFGDQQFFNGAWKHGLFDIGKRYLLLHLPSVLIMAYNHGGFRFGKLSEKDIYIWFFVLLAFIFIDSQSQAYGFFKKMSEEVKNEKYVRGRAIENIDANDVDN